LFVNLSEGDANLEKTIGNGRKRADLAVMGGSIRVQRPAGDGRARVDGVEGSRSG
jgi:hypothetical protein